MRSLSPAPRYWATNVVRYSPVPRNKLMSTQTVKSDVTAPATASGEYQVSNKRSTKVWSVKLMWPRMSG